MRKGLDCAASTLNSLLAARNAGITSVGRYLWEGGKGVTLRELRAISAVLGGDQPSWLVYEAGGQAVLGGAAAGHAAGLEIERLLRLLGLGPSVAVYGIAVDFTATAQQVSGPIRQYGEGMVGSVIAGRRLGAYGEGLVHETLLGLVTQLAWTWGVDESAGTPQFLTSGKGHIHQHRTVRGLGIEYDPDDLLADDFGGFRVPVLMQPGDHGDDVRLLQHQIGLAGLQVDGAFGEQTEQALGRWLAARELPPSSIVDDELWAKIGAAQP